MAHVSVNARYRMNLFFTCDTHLDLTPSTLDPLFIIGMILSKGVTGWETKTPSTICVGRHPRRFTNSNIMVCHSQERTREKFINVRSVDSH